MTTEVLKRANKELCCYITVIMCRTIIDSDVSDCFNFNAVIAVIKFGTKRPLAILVCC